MQVDKAQVSVVSATCFPGCMNGRPTVRVHRWKTSDLNEDGQERMII